MMLLHQDFWLWLDPTLVFGVMPIGLAYHASYSLLTTLVMALLVRYQWPADLAALETDGTADEAGSTQ